MCQLMALNQDLMLVKVQLAQAHSPSKTSHQLKWNQFHCIRKLLPHIEAMLDVVID